MKIRSSSFFLSFILFLVLPLSLRAEIVSSRTGFVDGSVWFSQEELSPKEKVTVYTAVFNGEAHMLTATIHFFDDDILLAEKDIYVAPNETKTVSITWTVGLGSHRVFAKIVGAEVSDESVIPERLETDPLRFTVTEEVPASVAGRALNNKFSEMVHMEKINIWFHDHFQKSEEFREEQSAVFRTQKEQLKNSFPKKDASTGTRVLARLHLILLTALVFIFSVPAVFYLVAVVCAYIILRIIWRILRRIFRRSHTEE